MSILSILLVVILVVAVCYAAFWIINSAFPAPINMIAKVLVGILGLYVLLQKTGLLAGLHV